ncbi:hypothetical protein GLYMA_09G053900v4 [Glycine max]|uniref:Uncharacterized protein n=1 Tax=Glycine max TaxID=3847 RepID=A0A0R0IB34_SOYBN|nr:hypothetical protein JHK86_024170 [Glycine max]KAH1041607.1 hypothetical protein GYH30_024118 [Glycine max]KRH37240.1 hypothetical protein GLYMA_09G053900v4 [Glycine max]
MLGMKLDNIFIGDWKLNVHVTKIVQGEVKVQRQVSGYGKKVCPPNEMDLEKVGSMVNGAKKDKALSK